MKNWRAWEKDQGWTGKEEGQQEQITNLHLQLVLHIHRSCICRFNRAWIETIWRRKKGIKDNNTVEGNTVFKMQYNIYLYSIYGVL
jgi:hypothetical protein